MLASLILVGVISFGIHYIFNNFILKKNFWKKYGVLQVDASPAASTWDILSGKKDNIDRDDYTYNLLSSTGDKFCGLIEQGNHVLLLRDIDVIKKVMIKDSDYFIERRDFFKWADEDSTITKMMITAKGEQWRNLRHTLSPVFTTGKIRRMMEVFNTIGKEWVDDLKQRANQNPGKGVKIEVLKSVSQYTVDVIAQSVFGIRTGTVQNPDSEFAQVAKRFTDVSKWRFVLGFLFPAIAKILRVEVFDLKSIAWLENILMQGLQERLKGSVKKNDFLQLLVEARKGELKAVADDELNQFEKDAQTNLNNGKKIMLTDDILNAQSLLFFIAGFGTTSNFITFILYALAAYPEEQEKLRKEVDKITKPNGDLDYDEVGQLPFMEMFTCEVLRLYPGVPRLERVCSREYKDPETGLHVPKGTFVAIPAKAIHTDPKYYKNPEKFDPEGHFSPERKAERSPYGFLPFGQGPRNCIGMRFAIIEAKAATAHIVHNFLIEPTEKTPMPMRGEQASLQILPPKGLELKLTPRH